MVDASYQDEPPRTKHLPKTFQHPSKFKLQDLRSAKDALLVLEDPNCPKQAIEQLELALDSLIPNIYKAIRAGLNAKDGEGKAKHRVQAEAANVWCRVKAVALAQRKLELDANAGKPQAPREPLMIEMVMRDQTVESIELARKELQLVAGKKDDEPVRFVIDVPQHADDQA